MRAYFTVDTAGQLSDGQWDALAVALLAKPMLAYVDSVAVAPDQYVNLNKYTTYEINNNPRYRAGDFSIGNEDAYLETLYQLASDYGVDESTDSDTLQGVLLAELIEAATTLGYAAYLDYANITILAYYQERDDAVATALTTWPIYNVAPVVDPATYTIVLSAADLISTASPKLTAIYNDGTDLHLIVGYYAPAVTFADINLVSGVTKFASAGSGRPDTLARHTNGKIYIATGDPSQILEWDFAAGTLTQKAASTNRAGGQSIAIGAKVYTGADVGGRFSIYDPVGDTYEEYINEAWQTAYNLRGYYVDVNQEESYLYISVAYTWLLVAFNTSTHVSTVLATTAGTIIRLYHTADRAENYALIDGVYYLLSGATATAVVGTPAGLIDASDASLVDFDRDSDSWPASYNYEFDFTDLIPYNAGDSTIHYREVGSGVWIDEAITVTQSAVATTHGIALDATTILAMTDNYNPVIAYTVATEAVIVLGGGIGSSRMALEITGGDIIFGAYFDISTRYNPAAAWTLNDTISDKTDPSLNPYQIADGVSAHERLCEDTAGNVWIGVHHVRTGTGSTLTRYTIATGATVDIRDEFDLEDWVITGLCAVGNYVAAGFRGVSGGNGRVLILDPTDNSAVADYTLDNIISAGVMVAIDATHFVGLAPNNYYKMDITDGSLDWSELSLNYLFNTTQPTFAHAELSPTSDIWLYIGDEIFAMTPATGALTKIANDTDFGNIIWHESIPYILGTNKMRWLVPI